MNGDIFLPHPPPPPPNYDPAWLEENYGNVPMIRDYVARTTGDRRTVWNAAYDRWDNACKEFVARVAAEYPTALRSGTAVYGAVSAALASVLGSELVQSARLDPVYHPDHPEFGVIKGKWRGLPDEADLVWLSPLEARLPNPSVSREEFGHLLHLISPLWEKRGGHFEVRLRFGNLELIGGPAAFKAALEGK